MTSRTTEALRAPASGGRRGAARRHRPHHQAAGQGDDCASQQSGRNAVGGDHHSAGQPSQRSHAAGAGRLQRDRIHCRPGRYGVGHQGLRGRHLERMTDAGERDQHERHPERFQAGQREDGEQRQQQRPKRGGDAEQPPARQPIADRSGQRRRDQSRRLPRSERRGGQEYGIGLGQNQPADRQTLGPGGQRDQRPGRPHAPKRRVPERSARRSQPRPAFAMHRLSRYSALKRAGRL